MKKMIAVVFAVAFLWVGGKWDARLEMDKSARDQKSVTQMLGEVAKFRAENQPAKMLLIGNKIVRKTVANVY